MSNRYEFGKQNLVNTPNTKDGMNLVW